MQNPLNLAVYNRSLDLAVAVHQLARSIPNTRAPGLASQLSRAAASIPANIAEGVGHPNAGRCPFHLAIAIGSAFEVETHLRLAARLCPELGPLHELTDEVQQIRRMTWALRAHKVRELEGGK